MLTESQSIFTYGNVTFLHKVAVRPTTYERVMHVVKVTPMFVSFGSLGEGRSNG